MYKDVDGDTILETPEEIKTFRDETDCEQCRKHANMMLRFFKRNKKQIRKIVFSTSCDEHA